MTNEQRIQLLEERIMRMQTQLDTIQLVFSSDISVLETYANHQNPDLYAVCRKVGTDKLAERMARLEAEGQTLQ